MRKHVGQDNVLRFQALLELGHMTDAGALLDRVSGRCDLFELSFKPIEIDDDDPIEVVFEPSRIRIRLVAHRSASRLDGQSHRLLIVLQLLVASKDKGARGALKICLMDYDNCDAVSFSSNRTGSVLIPDPEYLESNAHYEFADALAARPVKWTDRCPVVFWRGATTGQQVHGDWRRLPRIELCRSVVDRDGFDVGLTKVVQIADADAEAELRGLGLMRAFVPMTEAAAYRYQLDIDGNSNAWAGLFLKLMTGSPVLKVASPTNFRQWYYDRLVPFVNFVPVAADLSDLDAKADWLRRNDGIARKIGRAGRALALSLRYDRECSNGTKTIARRAS